MIDPYGKEFLDHLENQLFDVEIILHHMKVNGLSQYYGLSLRYWDYRRLETKEFIDQLNHVKTIQN